MVYFNFAFVYVVLFLGVTFFTEISSGDFTFSNVVIISLAMCAAIGFLPKEDKDSLDLSSVAYGFSWINVVVQIIGLLIAGLKGNGAMLLVFFVFDVAVYTLFIHFMIKSFVGGSMEQENVFEEDSSLNEMVDCPRCQGKKEKQRGCPFCNSSGKVTKREFLSY